MIQPTISVVVPIYNVELYLEECCNSILSQTFRDFELILVNDGATDNSYQIAVGIKEKDERVMLVTRKNGGLSAARNTGLNLAKGKYIMFVDSDDWIEPDCLKLLYENIEKYDSDVSCCRAQYVNAAKQKKVSNPFLLESIEAPYILEDVLKVKNFRTSAWCKLYNHGFLMGHQLLFQEGMVNEDTLFSLQIGCVARRISFVNSVLFDIREREGSISRSSFRRLFEDMHIAFNHAYDYIKKCGLYSKHIDKLYKARYLKSMLYNLLQIAQRLPYNAYLIDYDVCMEKTQYRHYGTFAKFLPISHCLMYYISLNPCLLYLTVRVLNLLNYKMH